MRFDTPLLLAAVRACGALERDGLSDVDLERANEVAERLGRRVMECEAQTPDPLSSTGPPREPSLVSAVALGWSEAPVPEELGSYPFQRLNTTQALAFAVCLALAWPDVRWPPYPGLGFPRKLAIDALGDMGVDPRRGKAALDGELRMMLLLVADGPLLRLGPAVAVLPATFTETMRRFHDQLPGREYAEPDEEQ